MKVVFNTSPLCYLILIDHIDILPSLFDEIVIPEAVVTELSHPGAPRAVAQWASTMPTWAKRRTAAATKQRMLDPLHAGERQAIALARDLKADWVILDDRIARRKATELGLQVMGLLGILDLGALRGVVDLPIAVERLRATSFHIDPELLDRLLGRHSG